MKISRLASIIGIVFLGVMFTFAQQYPIMDAVANKIVTKYQQSSCEELPQKKAQKAPPSPEEQKVVQLLKNDAQMRQAFINRIAAPIANKMFKCGMIP